MSRIHASPARPVLLGLGLLLTIAAPIAGAGDRFFRRARRPVVVQAVPTARRVDPVYGDRLGTFYPTPGIAVQGNYPAGGGYSPLGTYGENTMALYGPMSSLRAASAPLQTYTRGYDGVLRPSEAISTSYPNDPRLSPVAYPTRANHYYAPRIIDNPARDSAIEWLDHN